MIKPIKISSETIVLLIILAIGAVLRFYQFTGFSLSNDELSAITRARFDNFKDLIYFGVKTDDMHPAGTQVFIYYWIKIFGDSVFSIRFPFIISGILSILFGYLLASKWINKTAALFVAASIAFLEYPVLYSQIARPYSFGLLFTLISIWFWTKLLFDTNQKKYINILGYTLATSLITYTHHYAFLFAVIVGITGLFFLNKENAKGYFLSAFIIFLLYIPHIPIFIYQFSIGGVGEWLGPPKSDWLKKFIQYSFNDSLLVLYSFCFLFILSLLTGFRKKLDKFQLISAIWFLLSYFIGYYYSIYRNPILQYSTLIFSFPFLLIFGFSFVKDDFKLLHKVLLSIFASIVLYSTVIGDNYYQKQHFTEFRALATNMIKWTTKYGDKNTTKVLNLQHHYYIDYYLKKLSSPITFARYKYLEPRDLDNLKNIVDTCKTNYFIYGWSSTSDPPDAEDYIRNKYGVIVSRDTFLNSGITLYEKGEKPLLFKEIHNFEKIHQWENDSLLQTKEIFHSGQFSIKYTENQEFGPAFKRSLQKISAAAGAKINASAWFYSADMTTNAHLVLVFERKGLPLIWQSAQVKNFIKEKNKWTKISLTSLLPISKNTEDQVSVYIWNPEKKTFFIDDFEIDVYK